MNVLEADYLFHELWSKAVGLENYDRKQWEDFGRWVGQLLQSRISIAEDPENAPGKQEAMQDFYCWTA